MKKETQHVKVKWLGLLIVQACVTSFNSTDGSKDVPLSTYSAINYFRHVSLCVMWLCGIENSLNLQNALAN